MSGIYVYNETIDLVNASTGNLIMKACSYDGATHICNDYEYFNAYPTVNYTTPLFEGDTYTYWIEFPHNASFIDHINISTESNSFFYWNNTQYNMTRHVYTTKYNFTREILNPYFLNDVENISLQWNYTIGKVSGGYENTSTAIYNQTGYILRIVDCGTGYGNVNASTMNITAFEERNITALDMDIDVVFNIWYGNPIYNRSFNFSRTNINVSDYCIYPMFANASANITIHYSETGFDERYYTIIDTELDNESMNVSLYLTLDSLTSTTYPLVYNRFYEEQADVLIKIQRYYPSEGVWRTIEQPVTGYQGYAVASLEEDFVTYKFTFTQGGVTQLITTPMKVVCKDPTSYKCILEFIYGGLGVDYFEGEGDTGVSYIWDWNNNTKVMSFTFDDPSGATAHMRLQVTKEDISGTTTICNTTLSASSGTIECNASAYNTGSILGTAYREASPESWFSSYHVDYQEFWREFGIEGVFWGFLIFLTLTFTASHSPVSAVIMSLFAGIMLSFFNIVSFGAGITINFICLGIVILVVIVKNKFGWLQ